MCRIRDAVGFVMSRGATTTAHASPYWGHKPEAVADGADGQVRSYPQIGPLGFVAMSAICSGGVIGRAKPGFQLWGRETGINPDRANVAWPLGEST